MNILVIESSPHKHGSSNLLADQFIKGAKESGHQVTVFDAARADLHPCLGCDFCGMNGPCSQKDDGEKLKKQIEMLHDQEFIINVPIGGVVDGR